MMGKIITTYTVLFCQQSLIELHHAQDSPVENQANIFFSQYDRKHVFGVGMVCRIPAQLKDDRVCGVH